MTQPISISLVTQNSSLLGKTKVEVLKTLLGTQMALWPPEGMDSGNCSEFQNTNEFWVTPEAEECIMLRFGDQEVFKVPDIETWGWYLSWKYPDANIRFLPQSGTLKDMFIPDEKTRECPFRLPMLKRFFHDMKYWKNAPICRRAARWLASLDDPILKPFEFMQDKRHWEDWYLTGSHSQFRRTRVKILVDIDKNDVIKIVNSDSQIFWEQVCLQYEKWARDGISKQTCSNLEQAMKQWE